MAANLELDPAILDEETAAAVSSFFMDFNDPFSDGDDDSDTRSRRQTLSEAEPAQNLEKRHSKAKKSNAQPTTTRGADGDRYESMMKELYAKNGLNYEQTIANATPQFYLQALNECLKQNPMFTDSDSVVTGAGDAADETARFEAEVELLEDDGTITTLIPSPEPINLSKMLDAILKLEPLQAETGDSDAKATLQPELKKFRNRPLEDTKIVFDQNAWDDVEWDDEQITIAKEKVAKNTNTQIEDQKKSILENNASKYWDQFYGIHQNKFFKNRRWLFVEFPELQSPYKKSSNYINELQMKRSNESFPGENSNFRILEVGCGNGSTVFPLLELNNDEETYVYCCDFSETAVQIVKDNPNLDNQRCTPFVWDITDETCSLPFPPNSIDVVTMIFVLSAVSPEKFQAALRNIYKILKHGGLFLFRDYGLHDLVQLRLPEGRCISDNFYFRGDNTRVYFFTEAEIESLFQSTNFNKISLFTDRRLQVNRLKQLKMFRIWVQGKFVKV